MRKQKQILPTMFCAFALLGSSATVFSQSNEKKQETKTESSDTGFFHIATFSQEAGNVRREVFHTEFDFDGKAVEGAPYSADALTETSQTLGDGTRIVRNSSAKIYRDSAGRTRREETLKVIGAPADAEDKVIIFINDPIARVGYNLDAKTKTAHEMPAPPAIKARVKAAHGADAGAAGAGVETVAFIGKPANVVFGAVGPGLPLSATGGAIAMAGGPDSNQESLGTQTIEGVVAEGTRVTTTIPAGKIGNDRPLVIISERWFSPELKTVVLSKFSDPRTGESIYRLTNIVRSEPDPSLFQVPGDYKVEKGIFKPEPPRIELKKE